MGVGLGIVFALIPPVAGVAVVSFATAMVLKFLVVFLSVYAACRLGVGWTGKKFNDAVAHTMAAAHEAGMREAKLRRRLRVKAEAQVVAPKCLPELGDACSGHIGARRRPRTPRGLRRSES